MVSSLAISLLRKGELVDLLLVCCGCLCSVVLPKGAQDSVVCDCGVSSSYSLAYFGSIAIILSLHKLK